MAGLGTLTVDLAANIARFEAQLTRAEQIATKRSQTIKKVFSGMAIGIGSALASAGFTRAIDEALDYADAVAKTADKLGITTDALQEYRYAASLVGVEQKNLDTGLQRFIRRLGDAQEGGGELKGVLEDLKIPLRDAEGGLRSAEAVLKDYSNAIKNTQDPQKQLLYAFKAFDTEGAALVNLLRQGADGIDNYREEARSLGIVIAEDLTRNAETANDRLMQMQRVMQTGTRNAALKLAPAIIQLGDAFNSLVTGNNLEQLPGWVKGLTLGFYALNEILDGVITGIGIFSGAIQLLLSGEFIALGNLFASWGDQTERSVSNLSELLDKLYAVEAIANKGEEDKNGNGLGDVVDDISETNLVSGQSNEEMDADFTAYEEILNKAASAHKKYNDQKKREEKEFKDFKSASERAAFGEAIALLSTLGAKQKGFAIAAIALEKGLAIAEVVISTQAAAQKALALYGPTPAGYAAAAKVEALGAVRVGLIAATGLLQASNLGAGGGGGISGAEGTLGTSSNPIVTSSTDEASIGEQGLSGTITINVNGVVTEEVLQELIVPAIQEATNDKDVILFRGDSRQALELT